MPFPNLPPPPTMTQADWDRWERNRTQNSLLGAELYGSAAAGLGRVLQAIEDGGGLLDRDWVLEHHGFVCVFLAAALALPGPSEPEMAAVIADLELLKERYREWLA